MEITKFKNKIIIRNPKNFNLKKCLECGQIFRYKILDDNHFIIYETNNKIEIEQKKDSIIFLTKQPNNLLNYFDLNTNYDKINKRISKINPLIKEVVCFGDGIRIFKQNFIETIISFIISANNNIPRIKNSLFMLCERFGEKKKDYHAFPSLKKLQKITEQQWLLLGVGYRAKSLVKACSQISKLNLNEFNKLSTSRLKTKLIQISGVGPKVADCVLLFSLNRFDVFPTDTWIKKVYLENIKGKETNPKRISNELSEKFKNDSGLVQQYLFYYKRSKG